MNKSVLTLLSITLLSGAVLLSNTTSATKSVSNASVTVPEACTMTGSGMNSHTATITPGTFSAASGSDYENGIGKTTFTVICNDYNGFSIYAIGYTGDSYDDTNHTKLVGSNTNIAIDTAVYSGGDTTSSWSMKVNKVTDSTISYLPANMSIQNSFDSWHAVPDTYTKVAQYKANTGSSTTDTTLGAKIDTTYAAFIAPNQPGDTYVGQVKYTMVHPYDNTPKDGPMTNCPAGNICYSPGANDIEGTMGLHGITTRARDWNRCNTYTDYSTTCVIDGQLVNLPELDYYTSMLLASNYSRKGYGFAGWSDVYDYETNPNAHFYGPQETIDISEDNAANGLPLYAVWIASQGSLQDSTIVAELCGAGVNSLTTSPTDGTANLSSVSALTDQRDNETYAIAKLADSKCWMIENLRLESTNSDNSAGTLAQGYGTSTIYGNFSGLSMAESVNFSDSTTANSLYYSVAQSGDAIIDIGTTNYPGYRIPRYNNLNTQFRASNPTSNTFSSSNIIGGMYSYGNYYTWHAAIADTAFYSSGDHGTTSLCPTGWRLPLGNQSTTDNSFGALSVALSGPENGATAYSGSTPTGIVMSKVFRSYPNNFLYSGFFDASSANRRGSFGDYWSSTAKDNINAYRFSLDDSWMYPGNSPNYKYRGLSIRCTVPAST